MVFWPLDMFEIGINIYMEFHSFESSLVHILALGLCGVSRHILLRSWICIWDYSAVVLSDLLWVHWPCGDWGQDLDVKALAWALGLVHWDLQLSWHRPWLTDLASSSLLEQLLEAASDVPCMPSFCAEQQQHLAQLITPTLKYSPTSGTSLLPFPSLVAISKWSQGIFLEVLLYLHAFVIFQV